MRVASSMRLRVLIASSLLVACGGGGDGGTTVATVSSVVITSPAGAPTFGALGRTVQLTAQARDASNANINGATITWSSSNTAAATVSGIGLVTSVANGSANITATSGGIVSPMKIITVAQVPATVNVTSTSATPDTLFATTRTRQYTAAILDSTANAVVGAPAATFVSTTPAVATVNSGTGLATAVADGSTSIQATAGGITGTRTLIVLRLAKTHSIAPPNASITTVAGTQLLTGAATDSANTTLSLFSWVSRNPSIVSVAPASGGSTTATATGNGSAQVVMSVASVPVDSALITTSGQPAPPPAPATAAVSVGDFFFKSVHNNTTQPAVDTVAVNGTVTWTWTGTPTSPHFVQSTGAQSFTAQTTSQTSGNFQHIFTVAGTYTYQCGVHLAAMTGTIVVR